MNDLSFKKDSSALLIIDMQNGFISKNGSLSKMGLDTSRTSIVIKPIKRITKEFKKNKRPFFYIQHIHKADSSDAGMIAKVFPTIMDLGHCKEGSWDSEFIDELMPDAEDFILRKSRFSAFYNTELDDILKKMKIEILVVTGIATNVCVESNVRDAFYRDYNVFVPRETTVSFTPEQEAGSFGNFNFAFARVVGLDELIAQMK